jgi:hypothetical protein
MNTSVLFLAVFAFPVAAFSQSLPLAGPVVPETDGVYQVRQLAICLINTPPVFALCQPLGWLNFTNAGTVSGFDPAGRICVNVYAFDPAEELISCCACPVTPNGVISLSVDDLVTNSLTIDFPKSLTVKLLSSLPIASACNPCSPTTTNLTRGMRAWAIAPHLNTSMLPAPGVGQLTETEFSKVELSATELAKLTSFCGFIQANGSGFGICKSCRFGALGAEQK